MKTWLKHILVLGLFLVGNCFSAQDVQSPEDFFNAAAKEYIADNKLEAIKILNDGLDAHQGNERMTKLAEELLKKMEEEQED